MRCQRGFWYSPSRGNTPPVTSPMISPVLGLKKAYHISYPNPDRWTQFHGWYVPLRQEAPARSASLMSTTLVILPLYTLRTTQQMIKGSFHVEESTHTLRPKMWSFLSLPAMNVRCNGSGSPPWDRYINVRMCRSLTYINHHALGCVKMEGSVQMMYVSVKLGIVETSARNWFMIAKRIFGFTSGFWSSFCLL